MGKNRSLILLSLLLSLLMVACNNITDVDEKTKIINNSPRDNNQKNEKQDNNIQQLKEFVLNVVSTVKKSNVKSFKSMVADDGIISITYFVDKRDPITVIHVNKDEIRDDLVLINSNNKAGITLRTLLADVSEQDIKDLAVQLSNTSFDVDWHLKDEQKIKVKVEDIIKKCQEINLINNKYIPQVFVLKDNYFTFVIGSGVLEPKPEFVGNWIIFEKVDNDYKIHAVIQLQ